MKNDMRCGKNFLKDFILKTVVSDSKGKDDCGSYDDPDRATFCSKYTKWVRMHVKVLLLLTFIVSFISVLALLSLMTYAYMSKIYESELPTITHQQNQVHLYSQEDEEFQLPGKNSRLDGDVTEVFSLGSNEQERPYFRPSTSEEVSYEQSDGDSTVSHNEELHNLNNDDVVENASPDEFRITGHNIHTRKKHKKSKYREENAEARGKSFDILELSATTVPVTEEIIKSFREPPGNPKPTPTGMLINEKLTSASETAETRKLPEVNESPMTLYRVTNAIKAGAVCLDGSAPAYYHRPGSGNSEKLWIIHFNGGAWCFDSKACFERSLSSLGSTKKLPPSPPIIQGINSPDPTVNPDFFDWNLVWVVYCDGASFTGNREEPIITDTGEKIYLRGKRVLNAIINDLLYNRNFKLAEAIILTGSSAGSMTAMFQADYIASKFPKTIPVRVLSDAGFFIDTAPIGGRNLGAMFKRIYEMQNSSAGLNQDCVRDVGIQDGWQCFLPAKSMKYVKTPTFVLNSAYDIWALIYFLDIDCKFPSQAQKQRRKRNVNQALFVRSDSEIDMSFQRDEIDLNMFRRDLNTNHRRRRHILTNRKRSRDVSGFEILPFFRKHDVVSKDLIPSDLPGTAEHSDGDDKSTLNSTTEPDVVSSNTTTSNDTSKTFKKHPKSFTNFLKDIGSITTDNDIDILFHEINSDIVDHHDIIKNKESQTITENKTKTITENKTKTITENETKEIKENEQITTTSENKNNSETDLTKPNKPTIKLYIPLATGNSKTESSQNFLNSPNTLTQIQAKLSALQKLDQRRNKVTEGLNMTYQGHHEPSRLNFTLAFKRQNLNHNKKKEDALKSRRSTSIAKEYINILRSDPPECTEKDILNTMKYRGQLLHATDPLMRMPKSGRFLVSCIDHSLSLFDETWNGVLVGGKSIQKAFGDWFYERGGKSKHNLVDCPYPCNPSCP